MHKINIKNKNVSALFGIILPITLIIFFININIAYGSNINWIEVSKTSVGTQYWDRNSLISKDKGLIEINTKYLRVEAKNPDEIEESIYRMEINCLTNKYKDVSVNGKNNLSAKWEAPNGDKLINDVIIESCKNV